MCVNEQKNSARKSEKAILAGTCAKSREKKEKELTETIRKKSNENRETCFFLVYNAKLRFLKKPLR